MGGHVGVPLSTEHRAKLSTALKGRQFKPEHSVAMRRFYARQREPLIGRTFGRLTILAHAKRQGKHPVTALLCRCTCGSEKVVIWASLQSGNTRSCGCLRNDQDAQRRLTRINLVRGQVFWSVDGFSSSTDGSWLACCVLFVSVPAGQKVCCRLITSVADLQKAVGVSDARKILTIIS